MADVIDIANDQADYFLQVALDRRQRGDVVPEPRRVAAIGGATCIDCQAARERRR